MSAPLSVNIEALQGKAWEMFCILVRLRNLPSDAELTRSEIYQEIKDLTTELNYK